MLTAVSPDIQNNNDSRNEKKSNFLNIFFSDSPSQFLKNSFSMCPCDRLPRLKCKLVQANVLKRISVNEHTCKIPSHVSYVDKHCIIWPLLVFERGEGAGPCGNNWTWHLLAPTCTLPRPLHIKPGGHSTRKVECRQMFLFLYIYP